MQKKTSNTQHLFYRVIHSFGFAFAGIWNSFKTEIIFKIHIVSMFIVLLMGVILHLSTTEWLWILLVVALVIAAELMNTAIESLANTVSLEFHPLLKKAKDAAAGSVLILSIFALITAIIIFGPKLWNLIFFSL